ncbi:MAG: cysteine desulfurase [FCB group bacterium]|nr:cysteine desulfurase [FCB group bacterium]
MDLTDGLNGCRQDFPFFRAPEAPNRIYLDSAATTQKPQVVLDRLLQYYTKENANVHRGLYDLSSRATESYEAVRNTVARFLNVPDSRSVIFTRGATESINLVAYAWGRHQLRAGDEILVTEMEHHSNLIPWQETARVTGARLRFLPVADDGTLDLTDLDHLLTPRTKLLACVHQSNVLGTINPVRDLIRRAKQVGAVTLIDGAQSVPHQPVNYVDLGCDFLVFSGHKLGAPTGVGVLIGNPDLLEQMPPFLTGGEMIDEVFRDHATWNTIPHKFEAGTPNIAQVIALGTAIEYLERLGLEAIHTYGQELLTYALETLSAVPGIRFFGPGKHQGPVISFTLEGTHPQDVEFVLNKEGIAVRTGHHCAQPLLKHFGVSSLIRASFYIYSTRDDVQCLRDALIKAREFFS